MGPGKQAGAEGPGSERESASWKGLGNSDQWAGGKRVAEAERDGVPVPEAPPESRQALEVMGLWVLMPETLQRPNTPILCLAPLYSSTWDL